MTKFEQPKENVEQNIGKVNKFPPTNFTVEMENRKVEELITYSIIFKFKDNSGNDQELWGINCDFKSNQNKWTIDAILQHMGFILQQRIHV